MGDFEYHIDIKKGMKFSNGYKALIRSGVVCLLLILWFVTAGIEWMGFVFLAVLIIIGVILSVKYNKVKRIIKNQKILHTNIVECKYIYGSLEYMFKFEKDQVYLLSTFFDEEKGESYLFESFCMYKPFKKIPHYYVNYGEKCIIALEAIDICVNKNNYNEYFFLLDRLYPISVTEIEKMKASADGREVNFGPYYIIDFSGNSKWYH